MTWAYLPRWVVDALCAEFIAYLVANHDYSIPEAEFTVERLRRRADDVVTRRGDDAAA